MEKVRHHSLGPSETWWSRKVQNVLQISGFPKNVSLSHKNVSLDPKRTSYFDTAQQDEQLLGTFLWDTKTFFRTPDIYWHIGIVIPENVPASHKNVPLFLKRALDLEVQHNNTNNFWWLFHGTLERFFWTPDITKSFIIKQAWKQISRQTAFG